MENYYYITDAEYEEAEKRGISRTIVYQRWYLGWSKKDSLTKPPLRKKLNSEHFAIAEKNGISKNTVKNRVSRLKWEVEAAITIPTLKRENKYLIIARENGINESTFYSRLRQGWSEERASTENTTDRKECMRRALKSKFGKDIKVV